MSKRLYKGQGVNEGGGARLSIKKVGPEGRWGDPPPLTIPFDTFLI